MNVGVTDNESLIHMYVVDRAIDKVFEAKSTIHHIHSRSEFLVVTAVTL